MTRLTDPSTVSVGKALADLGDEHVGWPDTLGGTDPKGSAPVDPQPRSMRVRVQDIGAEVRIMKGSYFECPFPTHSLLEKWWNEGFSGKTSR